MSAAGAVVGSAQALILRVGNAIIGGDFTGNARGDYALDLQVLRTSPLSVASGSNAIALGNQAEASGNYSVAVGFAVTARGQNATALGSYAVADLQDELFLGGRFISTLETSPAGPATPTAPTTRIWFNGGTHRIHLRSQTIDAPLMYDGQAAAGSLSGTYPNPGVVWANGYATYDARYALVGSAAPVGSAFVTIGNDAALTGERALTGTANQVVVTDGGANAAVTLSTPQNIDSGANVQFAQVNIGSANRLGNILEAHVTGQAAISISEWAAIAGGSSFVAQHSRGASLGTHGAVLSNDKLGAFIGQGSDGSAFVNAGMVRVEADGNASANVMPGRLLFLTSTTNALAEAMRIDSKQNVIVSNAALATNATDGFLYIPSCAGTPTGAPTAYTGRVPLVYDVTNNKLYAYNGAWKSVTLA